MRVQPLTGGETVRKIEALKASLEVQPENTAHRVVDEMSSLFQVMEKNQQVMIEKIEQMSIHEKVEPVVCCDMNITIIWAPPDAGWRSGTVDTTPCRVVV